MKAGKRGKSVQYQEARAGRTTVGSLMRSVRHKRQAVLSSTPESGHHLLLLKGEGLGEAKRELENVRSK